MTPTNTQGSEQELRERLNSYDIHDKACGVTITHDLGNCDCNMDEFYALIKSDREAASKREAKMLNAIGLMYGQYCTQPYGHMYMGAGETAIGILEDYDIHSEELEWTSETYDKLDEVVAQLSKDKS